MRRSIELCAYAGHCLLGLLYFSWLLPSYDLYIPPEMEQEGACRLLCFYPEGLLWFLMLHLLAQSVLPNMVVFSV